MAMPLSPSTDSSSSVTAIMAWRLQITLEPTTLDDVTFGLGPVCLVSSLELWIGIIAACMPTLSPLYMHYITPFISSVRGTSKKSGQLNGSGGPVTIGGASNGKKSYRMRGGSKMDHDRSYLELEDSHYLRNTDARRGSDSTGNQHPNEIEVKHEITVVGTSNHEMV